MGIDEGRIDRAFLCEKVGNTAYCFEGSRGVEFGGTEEHILETQREIAPFVKADDAIVVDSTNLSIEEVVREIEKIIKSKMK